MYFCIFISYGIPEFLKRTHIPGSSFLKETSASANDVWEERDIVLPSDM